MDILKYVAAVLIIFLVWFPLPASDETTRGVVESMGMRDVKTTGYPWFACGEGDRFNTGFTATSANGRPVSGAVCCGWFKGCTVRLD